MKFQKGTQKCYFREEIERKLKVIFQREILEKIKCDISKRNQKVIFQRGIREEIKSDISERIYRGNQM